MTRVDTNACRRCSAPISRHASLCESCREATTAAGNARPTKNCIACGTVNMASARLCSACSAPLPDFAASPVSLGDPDRAARTNMRPAELQVLEDCLRETMNQRRGVSIYVTGESGTGTTFLLQSFADWLKGRLPEDHIFHMICRNRDETFGPLRGAFRKRFKIRGDEDSMTARIRLTNEIVGILGPDSAALVTETAHLIGYLTGLPFPDSPVLRTLERNQELLHKRLSEAIRRILARETSDSPVAFVFDDLQREELDDRRFMAALTNTLTDLPVLFVFGGPPHIAELKSEDDVVVELEPLDETMMRKLFTVFAPHLLHPPEALVEAAIGRAGGNPGSLNELIRLFVESGVIDNSEEPWTVNLTKMDAKHMPVGLADALKARLDRLDLRDRQVLERAAIIGEIFWDEAIVALTRQKAKRKVDIKAAQIWSDDSDVLTVNSALGRLVERKFAVPLTEQDIPGCTKYAFSRRAIREQILLQMDQDEVKQGRLLAAEWLHHADSTASHLLAEAEANHWEAADNPHQAALAYFQAARHARKRFLNVQAVELFNKGLALADPDDRLTLMEAYHDLGSVHELLGEYEPAEEALTKMLKHAWLLNHRAKAGAAFNKIGRLYRSRADATAARAFLERGMALFKAAADEPGMASCLADMGELARRQGLYDRAFQRLTQALIIQRKYKNHRSIAVCLHSLGHVEAARGSYTQAERFLEEAFDIQRALNDRQGMAGTLSALAVVEFSRGQLDQAIDRWQEALTIATEVGDRRVVAMLHNNLGEALRDLGNLDKSMQHFKACEEVAATLEDLLLHSEVARNIGILARKMGNHDLAEEQLTRSLELAREAGLKELEALALRALGELAALTMWDTSNVAGRDDAEYLYGQALKIFKQIGNEFEIARTLHLLGNRFVERGEIKKGTGQLEEARSIFTRIQSVAGDAVARTIEEILAPPKSSSPKSQSAKLRRRRRSKNDDTDII